MTVQRLDHVQYQMNWRTIVAEPKLQLRNEVGRKQGYGTHDDILRAANRALRWVRQPCNKGRCPPGHIANKMLLIGVHRAS